MTAFAGDHDDFVNELFDNAPDSWDDDVAAEAIALDYLHHCEGEVERLGGCLRRCCMWVDGEPCDHGYLPEAIAPPDLRSATPIMDRAVKFIDELIDLCEDCLTPERQELERDLLNRARRFIARPEVTS